MSSEYNIGLNLLNSANSWSVGMTYLSSKELKTFYNSLNQFNENTKFITNINNEKDIYFNELKRNLIDRINFINSYLSIKNEDSISIKDKIELIVKQSNVSKKEFKNISSWLDENFIKVRKINERVQLNEFYFPELLNFQNELLSVANKLTKKYFTKIKQRLTKKTYWGSYLKSTNLDFSNTNKPAHHPLGNIISLPIKQLFAISYSTKKQYNFNFNKFLGLLAYELGHSAMFSASEDNIKLPYFLKKNPLLFNSNYSTPFKESVAEFYGDKFLELIISDKKLLSTFKINKEKYLLIKKNIDDEHLLNQYKMTYSSFSFFLESSYGDEFTEKQKKEYLERFALSKDSLKFSSVKKINDSNNSIDSFFNFKEYLPYSIQPIRQELNYLKSKGIDYEDKQFTKKLDSIFLESGYLSVEGFKEKIYLEFKEKLNNYKK